MAARKRKVALTDDWKANIQATQLMNRLYSCAMGEVLMSSEQLNAAKTVLAKILPDLARQELTGKDGEDIRVQNIPLVIAGVAPKK